MIINPELLTASVATSTVAPIPTITPGNDPLYEKAGDVGNRTLWVVVVLLALSSLTFYGMACRVPVQKRLFYILTSFITTISFLSYFALATGDGITYHKTVIESHPKSGQDTSQTIYREVYWARYVDWSITAPLLLLDLTLLAGLSGANVLVTLVASVIMALSSLFAAFGDDAGQKWGWYTWSCLAFLTVVYHVGFNSRAAVANKDSKTKAFYAGICSYTLIVWVIYPIVWGLSSGGRVINVDAEIIANAVLDILAKPVFGFWFLFTLDSMSSTSPSIDGFWATGFSGQGTLRVGDDDQA